jgi:hypothetical protein
VALGSVRFGINRRESAKDRETGRILLEQVSALFPRDADGKVSLVHFSFTPGSVYPSIRERYRELAEYLAECGLPPSRIPGER